MSPESNVVLALLLIFAAGFLLGIKKTKSMCLVIIALYLVLYSSAMHSFDLFVQSADFRRNIWTFSRESCGFDFQIIKCAAPLINDIVPPEKILIFLWSLIPTLLVAFTLIFGDALIRSHFKASFITVFMNTLSAFFVILYSTKNFFGAFAEQGGMPTAHILMQSVSVVFVLPLIYLKAQKQMWRHASALIAIIIHPVSILYTLGCSRWLFERVSSMRLTRKNRLFGINVTMMLLIAIILAASPILIPIFYQLYRQNDDLTLDALTEIHMGVASSKFIYMALLMNLTFLVIVSKYKKLFAGEDRSTTSLFQILANLKRLVVAISLVVAILYFFSIGLAYRIGYIFYVYAPLLAVICLQLSLVTAHKFYFNRSGRDKIYAIN